MQKKPIQERRQEKALQRYTNDPRLSKLRFFVAGPKGQRTTEGISFSQILKHGKPFIGGFSRHEFVDSKGRQFIVRIDQSTHESPVGLFIDTPGLGHLGRVRLAFQRGAVLIEAVQGEPGPEFKELKRFEGIVGMPWPNYLIRKLEATARRLGYSTVGFRDVETLFWYQQPLTGQLEKEKGVSEEEATKIIQERMHKFYTNIREALGYTTRKGEYWIKKL